jgi:glutamine amidotransferase
MITIVNYGSGNVRAIGNIFDVLNIPYAIVSDVKSLEASDKIILPGVGAFDETMGMLNSNGFRDVLDKKALVEKVPILGICVGMQMLANQSEEGSLSGLGWIPGIVKMFDKSKIEGKPKLPHLGWNSIKVIRNSPLFRNIDEQEGFYFIHTYYFECAKNDYVLSTTDYGIEFHSAVNKDNIYGVQFHPEKSHTNGVQLLKNFATIC